MNQTINEARSGPALPAPPVITRPVIAQLAGVTHRFGSVVALEAVDLALGAGQVTALLGPNGAGKTTAIKLLLGLATPSEGSARLFGRDPREASARRRAGAMLQVAKLPETLTVREHLRLFAAYYPRPLPLDEVLSTCGLDELADRRAGRLSGGQQQRLALALALVGDPQLLFLDEPTLGLDVEARRSLWEEVRKLAAAGRAVLLTTHYLEEADALADRVVVIAQGRIVADGTPVEIKARSVSRRVRCATRLPLAEVLRLPGVVSASLDRGRVEILATEAELVVRQLLDRDADLADLEVVATRLEDAFLALTTAPTAQRGAA